MMDAPKIRDCQLAIAAIWLYVADDAKKKLSECNRADRIYAEFWELLCERATSRALDHMRAGLHKKTERSAAEAAKDDK